MTDVFTKTFSSKSNAKRAASGVGLEPCEYTIEPEGTRFKIVKRTAPVSLDESLKIAGAAFKKMTPAERAEPKPALAVIDPIQKHIPAAKPAKSAKPQKAAQADPAVAEEIRALFQIKAPRAQHIEALEAARRGTMPVPPDLSKPSFGYTKRRFLDRIQAAIETRDMAAVKAIAEAMKVSLWEQRAVRAYGLLAVIAMEAGAQ